MAGGRRGGCGKGDGLGAGETRQQCRRLFGFVLRLSCRLWDMRATQLGLRFRLGFRLGFRLACQCHIERVQELCRKGTLARELKRERCH